MDERFLLRGRARLGFLATASFEILEVGGEAQVQVFLFGEFRAEWVRLCRSGFGDDGVGLRSSREWVLDFVVHGSRM